MGFVGEGISSKNGKGEHAAHIPHSHFVKGQENNETVAYFH